MKMLFVAQNFQVGGITTALINMLSDLVGRDGLEVDVFSFGEGPFMEDIPTGVKLYRGKRLLCLVATPFKVVLQSRKVMDIFLRVLCMIAVRIMRSDRFYRILFKYERNFEGYDVVISYWDDISDGYFNRGTLLYVAEFVHNGRKIAWSHTDPWGNRFDKNHYLKMYSQYDKVICVSYAIKSQWEMFLGSSTVDMEVVHNFVRSGQIRKRAEEERINGRKGAFYLVTVARIDNISKRIDRVIETCRLLKKNGCRNFVWRIVGDGPDLEAMKALAEAYTLSDIVEFTGYQKNPYPYIKASQLFVLTSDFEGLPTVVRESQILGIPVLSTDYDSAQELITDGVDGFIVGKDETQICRKIMELMRPGNGELDAVKKYLEHQRYDNQDLRREFVKKVLN